MTVRSARLVMTLALRALPPDGLKWGQAMQAEFGEAVRDGKPMLFALGCLLTACRRLPFYGEGRLTLLCHALSLGLIVPIAIFHLGCAVSGAKFLLSGHDRYHSTLLAGDLSDRVAADAYEAAAPALTMLLCSLGIIHLVIAWLVLDRHWRRAAAVWLVAAVVAAALVTVIVTTAPSIRGIAVQLAALTIELAALPLLAIWQTRMSRSPSH